MGRIVAFDPGERRIGMAISDPTGTLARPIGVLHVTALGAGALDRAAGEVARLAAEEDGVEAIVVGRPSRLSGEPNDMTLRVEGFAAQLAARTGLPVSLQDERLSSREAEARLARREKDWRARKARVDAAAAAIILQDFLDTHPVVVAPPATVDSEP